MTVENAVVHAHYQSGANYVLEIALPAPEQTDGGEPHPHAGQTHDEEGRPTNLRVFNGWLIDDPRWEALREEGMADEDWRAAVAAEQRAEAKAHLEREAEVETAPAMPGVGEAL